MTTVDKDKKTGAEKAVEVKPPTDGAHSYRARKSMMKEKQEDGDPAYVVAVARPKDEDGAPKKDKAYYKPEDIKAKARALLGSGKLSPQEKEVIQNILGDEKPPLEKKK